MMELKITFDSKTGEINVDGPWADGILFLGMLDMARLAFFEGHSKGRGTTMEKSIIIPDLMLGKKPS